MQYVVIIAPIVVIILIIVCIVCCCCKKKCRPAPHCPRRVSGGGGTRHTPAVCAPICRGFPRPARTRGSPQPSPREPCAQPHRCVTSCSRWQGDRCHRAAGRASLSCSAVPVRTSHAPVQVRRSCFCHRVRKCLLCVWGVALASGAHLGTGCMSSLRVKCSRGISHLLAAAQPSLDVQRKHSGHLHPVWPGIVAMSSPSCFSD